MEKPLKNIRIIAFDADDTLWVNEPYFRETEDRFCGLLEDYLPHHSVAKELYKTEIANLELYGYGIKSFMLSMIETIHRVTEGKADMALVNRTIELGKEMLDKPLILIEGVEYVLNALHGKYRIVLATKGDLLDQERKLNNSGLQQHFHHIEVMSEKKKTDYEKLLRNLDCAPEEFLMVGNSVKSDVLPVLDLGGNAIHVPFHTTWVHEEIKPGSHSHEYPKVGNINEVLEFLDF